MVGWFAPQKMKQQLLNYSLGFIAMLFASCDCVREVQAVVLDTSTGQAVEAVMVREAHGQELEIARILFYTVRWLFSTAGVVYVRASFSRTFARLAILY